MFYILLILLIARRSAIVVSRIALEDCKHPLASIKASCFRLKAQAVGV